MVKSTNLISANGRSSSHLVSSTRKAFFKMFDLVERQYLIISVDDFKNIFIFILFNITQRKEIHLILWLMNESMCH